MQYLATVFFDYIVYSTSTYSTHSYATMDFGYSALHTVSKRQNDEVTEEKLLGEFQYIRQSSSAYCVVTNMILFNKYAAFRRS